MPDERVSIQVTGSIADVRLNRPDKLNAIDSAMFAALSEASASLAGRDDVRAVVLSGAGRAFCAGLDLGALGSGMPADLSERTHGLANLWQHAVWGWRELPVPVIAAVHGAAFGGGLQLALAADIRIVAPDAQLAVMEARWGLVPDMAGFALLRDLVRGDVARELTYTARKVPAAEAVEIGLATRVADDPRAAALELAAAIADRSPLAVRAAKRLFATSRDAGAADILRAESREQQRLIGGPDVAEILTAQAENRPLRFLDPPHDHGSFVFLFDAPQNKSLPPGDPRAGKADITGAHRRVREDLGVLPVREYWYATKIIAGRRRRPRPRTRPGPAGHTPHTRTTS